jgi:hypothetical protein
MGNSLETGLRRKVKVMGVLKSKYEDPFLKITSIKYHPYTSTTEKLRS